MRLPRLQNQLKQKKQKSKQPSNCSKKWKQEQLLWVNFVFNNPSLSKMSLEWNGLLLFVFLLFIFRLIYGWFVNSFESVTFVVFAGLESKQWAIRHICFSDLPLQSKFIFYCWKSSSFVFFKTPLTGVLLAIPIHVSAIPLCRSFTAKEHAGELSTKSVTYPMPS